MKPLVLTVWIFCATAAVFAADPEYRPRFDATGSYLRPEYGGILKSDPQVPRSMNVLPTEPYMKTQVQAQLKMEIAKDTDQVHFIRNNNDPYVVTKVYLLKNADPYEIRPFVLRAAQANRVYSDNTTVECIKYNDGAGALIVSAEEYRFKKQETGMTIDEIVSLLDQPKVTSSSGQTTFLYFPKYWDARYLSQAVKEVGANIFGDNVELQFGRDSIQWDEELNAMLMFVPRYSQKNIAKMLEAYDVPTYEMMISYKLYEIYAENDVKIGADFQAWKNNDGADLFSVGGRYRDGWSATWSGGADKSGSSKTGFLNFNPKWNTRYLDFLQSKGKSRVLTQGDITVMNRCAGIIEVKNNIFNFENGEQIADGNVITGAMGFAGTFVVSSTSAAAANVGDYRIQAFDSGGNQIDIAADFSGKFTASRIADGNISYYTLRIASESGGSFVKGGRNLGRNTTAFSFTPEVCVDGVSGKEWQTISDWSSALDLSVQKGYTVNTNPATIDYGFSMTVVPEICEKSAIVSLSVTNDSLIGWKSDGAPRIARDTEMNTKIMFNDNTRRFVIGGMEKRSMVTTVTGVPLLKDIPVLGYLFSTEATGTKRSQLVMVMECRMMTPESEPGKDIKTEIKRVDSKLGDAGESVPLASGQYLIGRN